MGKMNRKFLVIFTLILLQWGWGRRSMAQQKSDDLFSVYRRDEVKNRNLTHRDIRFMHMKGTNTQFTLPKYKTLDDWEKHAKYVKDQVLISAGLWPEPRRTPLHSHIFNKIKHEEYTVAKVYIEPIPNFYLAGNLYTPTGNDGPHPGILVPHGHWSRGRLQNGKRASSPGHVSVPGRCINLARQGYVAFSYDMIGYGDTRQLSHSFAAGDSLAQLWNINLLGLQLWDSMRALEFLQSLPEVNPYKMGITGASGGATQTFLLDAVVDSGTIDVSAPVNQISAVMQGGDLCENAPGLRLNTFNVEIAGLFAPRPQLMVSDTHDWTQNTPWMEYPMMRSIYQLYHASGKLKYAYFDYYHNYNQPVRELVYRWFHEWMPARSGNISNKEQPFTVEPDSSLLVFMNKDVTDRNLTFHEMDPSLYHNLPRDALQMDEKAMIKYLADASQKQFQQYWPGNRSEWKTFNKFYGTGYRHSVAAVELDKVHAKVIGVSRQNSYKLQKLIIERSNNRDWIPAILLQPEHSEHTASGGVTMVIAPNGKSELLDSMRGKPGSLVQKLLDQGQSVLLPDLFNTGEHILPEGNTTQRNVSADYFTTFNKTDTQERVQDILTLARYMKVKFPNQERNLIGLRDAGIWSLLAAPLTGDFSQIICDADQLNPIQPKALLPFFIPGLAKYGDIRTAMALSAGSDTRLNVYNVSSDLDIKSIRKMYEFLGHSSDIQIFQGEPERANLPKFLKP